MQGSTSEVDRTDDRSEDLGNSRRFAVGGDPSCGEPFEIQEIGHELGESHRLVGDPFAEILDVRGDRLQMNVLHLVALTEQVRRGALRGELLCQVLLGDAPFGHVHQQALPSWKPESVVHEDGLVVHPAVGQVLPLKPVLHAEGLVSACGLM
ncbi:MAG: hypothetical protein WEA54_01620 [Actinomycetota bacterium]